MTTASMPKPDTTEMIVVHDVFRDTLVAAPTLLNDLSATEPRQAAILRNFYENIIDFLAVHHQGEDELMFPRLRERAPEQAELIDRINAQHHDVDALVDAATAALAAWTPGSRPEAAAAADALRRLGEGLNQHLEEEEQSILPLVREHLTLPEWGELPAHGMQHFRGDKVWLVVGLIRERMTQQQRDDMLAHMPPPAVDMWTGFGEQAFNELLTMVGPPLR